MNENSNMCADNVRDSMPLFRSGRGGATPTSALQLSIREIDRYLARDLNAVWHSRLPIYNTGFCLNSLVSYGAEYEGMIYAVAIWTNPVSPALPQKEWLELRRMAVAPDAPKNTASRMLGVMARLIRMKFPGVTTLVSYQDEEVHKGTIYKASGWLPTHRHKGGSWSRPNAVNRSNGKTRSRPDLNGATGPKIRWEFVVRKTEDASGEVT